MLIGGDPGIGKSTLLLQVCAHLCRQGQKVLYVSGEESAKQIKLRARRLGIDVPGLYVLAENALDNVEEKLQQLQPDMIGIGPYITHAQTPFANEKSGSLELTLRLLSILRLLFPYALLPSTTALGTIHPQGRELGLKAGGNVVMPNLSPVRVRKLYELYENKICTGEEAAQCRGCLEQRVKSAGYEIVTARGDVKR